MWRMCGKKKEERNKYLRERDRGYILCRRLEKERVS